MRASNMIVVEGKWAVEALIDSPNFEVEEAIIESARHPDLEERLAKGRIPFRVESRAVLERESGYAFHRGVFARAIRPVGREPSRSFLQELKHGVVPVGLADPGNLGTTIRSAVAFGAGAVLVEKGRGADVYSRKCIRASATAIFRVPVFEVENLAATLEEAKEVGLVVFGTSLYGRSTPLSEVRPAARSLVLAGSEADGLSRELQSLCDECLHIPMAGGMDSLNVAASVAIACYELFRGRE